MFLKISILIALLALGIQALPNKEQQLQQQATLEEQIAAWASFSPPVNSVQKVDAGSAIQQQHHVIHHQEVPLHGHPSEYPSIHAGSMDNTIDTHSHSPIPTQPAAGQPNQQNDNEKDRHYAPYPYFPYYEDQVIVYPQNDEDVRDSTEEEQEVWPPVGIYPPPPPPSTIRPTFYPPYYPTLPTKPTARPTVTTTIRPRPPQYPPLYPSYPKPPQYPLYPLDQLPHLPQYPRPTTARPTTTTTTTRRPTTQRPTTQRPPYQKPGAGADAVVLESYQVLSDKGITAYKLRLSNGLNDYKKITEKQVGKDTIYVQTGYYSVPVNPEKNEFVIYRYIADEKGYRITGVQTCADEAQCLITLGN
ncbi:extensin [Ceratitis capitata]|uniref:extensin n=1 Tax=Ceratitis capitata TaxID=7213 RepID=UPI000A117BB7|nr:extensin [Ceratitis capitata]